MFLSKLQRFRRILKESAAEKYIQGLRRYRDIRGLWILLKRSRLILIEKICRVGTFVSKSLIWNVERAAHTAGSWSFWACRARDQPDTSQHISICDARTPEDIDDIEREIAAQSRIFSECPVRENIAGHPGPFLSAQRGKHRHRQIRGMISRQSVTREGWRMLKSAQYPPENI